MAERYGKRRTRALLGAAAASVIALSGVAASAAFAEAPSFGNIDAGETGSLTLHKHLHQGAGSTPSDPSGTGTGFPANTAIGGIEFTMYKLNYVGGAAVDLTNPDHWNGNSTATPAIPQIPSVNPTTCAAPAGYEFDTNFGDAAGVAGKTLVTGTDGQLTFPGLALSLYLVCENDDPSTPAMVNGAPVSIIDAADPFLVTIPTPYQDGWVYDVHAYPKNGTGEIEKDITTQPDDQVGLGSTVKFPVTVTIPRRGAGETWQYFAVSDVFDPRLEPAAAPDSVTLNGVTLDPSYYEFVDTPGNANGKVLRFTAAGLAYLNTPDGNAHAGEALVVTFAAKVISLGVDDPATPEDESATIPNKAGFWPDGPATDGEWDEPEVPSNEVEEHWGDLTALKFTNATGSKVSLAGAVFQVYNANPSYPPAGGTCSASPVGAPISVTSGSPAVTTNEFTSDSNGLVHVAGLFVSDSENPPVNATERCYVLVEIKAPAGYTLPSNPNTAVTVTAGKNAVGTYDVEIENTQQNVPELPLTGAAGQVLMIAGGVAAVAVAAGLVLLNRRRARVLND